MHLSEDFQEILFTLEVESESEALVTEKLKPQPPETHAHLRGAPTSRAFPTPRWWGGPVEHRLCEGLRAPNQPPESADDGLLVAPPEQSASFPVLLTTRNITCLAE